MVLSVLDEAEKVQRATVKEGKALQEVSSALKLVRACLKRCDASQDTRARHEELEKGDEANRSRAEGARTRNKGAGFST